jgi:uncharacterized RDD family membrane protein YckC
VVCAQCGAAIKLPANFCGVCGKALLKEERGRLPTQPLIRADDVPRPASRGDELRRTEISIAASPASRDNGAPGGPMAAGPPATPVAEAPAGPRSSPPRAAARPAPRPVVPPPVPGLSLEGAAPAGFWIRLAAYAIDSFIVAVPMLLLGGVAFGLLLASGALEAGAEAPPAVPTGLMIVLVGLYGLALLISIAYPIYFWGARGATPGKKLLGLTVVNGAGESPIGYSRAFLRLVGYLINGFTFGIGFLLIALSEDKRGLHDRIADTRVVRRS